jgi:hypothetical protein
MVAVAPFAANASPPRRSPHVRQSLKSAARWVYSLVSRLPGQYTASKLDAFDQFQRRTSRLQVAAILFLTPMPCVLINLLVETIPLADPTTGFRHSVAFQARHFLASVMQNILPALVKKDCVPDFPTGSWKLIVAFGLIQAVVGVVTNAVISLSTGVFPVPFAHFTPIIPMTIVGTLICYRRQAWGPELPDFRAKSTQIDNRLGMELLPIVVYPVFTALFMALTPMQQLCLSLLLPVIKLALRRWLWLVSKSDEDLVGVITCCAGHWYHILFTAVIFQTAKSYETLAAIGLFNIVQMLFSWRNIVLDADALNEAKAQLEKDHTAYTSEEHVTRAIRFTQDDAVAAKLHAKAPSALLSTYSGYHESSFIERHRKLIHTSTSLSLSAQMKARRKTSAAQDTEQFSAPEATKPKLSSSVQVAPWSEDDKPASPQSHCPLSLRSADELEPAESPSTITREVYVQRLASALHQTEMILLRSFITISATFFYGKLSSFFLFCALGLLTSSCCV